MRLRRVISIVMAGALCLSATGSTRAQTVASARAFLNSIFQLYDKDKGGVPYSTKYLHSSLLALIRADLKAADAAKELPGPLDADIVCNCQEWAGIWLQSMEVKLAKPGSALVTAAFDIEAPENRDPNHQLTMRYTLVPEHGQWRIYDIQDISADADSDTRTPLRKAILKDLDYFKHEPR